MIRLSVVLPMYNEEKTIENNILTLNTALRSKLQNEYESIAVNDGSRDRTLEIVASLEKRLPALRLFSYEKNKGKGGALKEGMTRAEGSFVLFTDSDLAYGTDQILHFLEIFESDPSVDILLGSRAIAKDGYKGYSPLRVFMSKCYLWIVSLYAGFSHSDSQCGIKGFKKEMAHRLFGALETMGFAFDLEILLSAKDHGAKIIEVPVKIINHNVLASSVSPVKDALKMLKDLHKIKKRRKIHQ